MQTESRSFNQVSVKIQRPKSLPTAWSMIVSTLFLTERALQMAKRRLFEGRLDHRDNLRGFKTDELTPLEVTS